MIVQLYYLQKYFCKNKVNVRMDTITTIQECKKDCRYGSCLIYIIAKAQYA